MRVNSIMIQITSNGEIMETKNIVEKFMQSLPRKFDHLVVDIEESQDISSMSLERLQGRLEVMAVIMNVAKVVDK